MVSQTSSRACDRRHHHIALLISFRDIVRNNLHSGTAHTKAYVFGNTRTFGPPTTGAHTPYLIEHAVVDRLLRDIVVWITYSGPDSTCDRSFVFVPKECLGAEVRIDELVGEGSISAAVAMMLVISYRVMVTYTEILVCGSHIRPLPDSLERWRYVSRKVR